MIPHYVIHPHMLDDTPLCDTPEKSYHYSPPRYSVCFLQSATSISAVPAITNSSSLASNTDTSLESTTYSKQRKVIFNQLNLTITDFDSETVMNANYKSSCLFRFFIYFFPLKSYTNYIWTVSSKINFLILHMDSSSATEGHWGHFPLYIMINVIKWDQICCFQHKNGNKKNYAYINVYLFTFFTPPLCLQNFNFGSVNAHRKEQDIHPFSFFLFFLFAFTKYFHNMTTMQ